MRNPTDGFTGIELLEPRRMMAAVSEQVIVDQFGYRTDAARKVALLAKAVVGQNNANPYTPGTQFQVRRVSDNVAVFTGTAVPWNGGATHGQSGDKVWTADFSSLNTPGQYYVYDVANDVKSYDFAIANSLYNDVLRTSARTYYYQRTGVAIPAQFGGNWTHAIDHVGPNQDTQAKLWQNNGPVASSTPRDVSGGWFDAGDYNKYVPFTTSVMWNLLYAYELNPGAFSDATNIPESGNNTPDILDELKVELNWLLKMQLADGSVMNRVSNATYASGNSDPSTDTQARYYTAATTWATASFAASCAKAARSIRPYDSVYADTLVAAAQKAWLFLKDTPNMTPASGNDGGSGLASALANTDAAGDLRNRILAAAELYKTTGDATYKTYFDSNYNNAAAAQNGQHPLLGQWPHFDTSLAMELNRAFVTYATTPGASASIVSQIKASLKTMADDQILAAYNSGSDPYRGYMYDGHYSWGSNTTKSEWGNLLLEAIQLNVNPANNAKYREAAEEYLHYFHGRNPLSQVYLSNMGTKGANLGGDKSMMQPYHSWFGDGSTLYDGANSTYGPVPGYLAGGANVYFTVNWITPPYGQPAQKSFKDWNTGWNPTRQQNENSWEITEPAIYSQAAYTLLLSAFSTDTFKPAATLSADATSLPQGVTVKFSENVAASLAAGDAVLANIDTGATVPLTLSYDAATLTGRFNVSGTLPESRYRFTLDAANVTDAAGNPLAANVTRDFTFFRGDMDNNGVVNNADIAPFVLGLTDAAGFASQYGYTPTLLGDLNADGVLNNADIAAFVAKLTGGRPVAPSRTIAPAAPSAGDSDDDRDANRVLPR